MQATGWLDIDGGTGRFSGADGQLWQDHVIAITSDAPPWPLAMTFVGTIDTGAGVPHLPQEAGVPRPAAQ